MKSRFILFASALLLLMTFGSCEIPYDPAIDESGGISSNIVGEWQGVSMNYTGTTHQDFGGGIILDSEFVGEGSNFSNVMTFTEDPNNFTYTGAYDVAVTSTTNGVSTTVVMPGLVNDTNGTWSLSGDQLEIIVALGASGNSATYTILELTDHTLRMSMDTTVQEVNGPTIVTHSVIGFFR